MLSALAHARARVLGRNGCGEFWGGRGVKNPGGEDKLTPVLGTTVTTYNYILPTYYVST